MTSKAEFNAEEWSKVTEAPVLAAMLVIASDRGGTIRESVSLARAYSEARKEGVGAELLNELVSSPPQADPKEFGSVDALREQVPERLRAAVELVEEKGTPEEADAYRQFVLRLADTVAHAHKEGGFLGIGGKEVSEEEQKALDQLETAVGGGTG
jgi:hypothetical protein